MPVFAVCYDYVDDVGGLDEHRPAHREFLGRLAASGALRASGPFATDGGPPGALLLLRAPSAEAVQALLRDDPFASAGLIEQTVVREWAVLSGPVREAIAEGA